VVKDDQEDNELESVQTILQVDTSSILQRIDVEFEEDVQLLNRFGCVYKNVDNRTSDLWFVPEIQGVQSNLGPHRKASLLSTWFEAPQSLGKLEIVDVRFWFGDDE